MSTDLGLKGMKTIRGRNEEGRKLHRGFIAVLGALKYKCQKENQTTQMTDRTRGIAQVG